MPEIQAPSEAQKEQSAASRLAGQMKPGQAESYHRNILLLEGIPPERVADVLAQAKRLYQQRPQYEQSPLKLRAIIQMLFGVLAFLVAAYCLIFVMPEVKNSEAHSKHLWVYGLVLVLAGFGCVSLLQGFILHRKIRNGN